MTRIATIGLTLSSAIFALLVLSIGGSLFSNFNLLTKWGDQTSFADQQETALLANAGVASGVKLVKSGDGGDTSTTSTFISRPGASVATAAPTGASMSGISGGSSNSSAATGDSSRDKEKKEEKKEDKKDKKGNDNGATAVLGVSVSAGASAPVNIGNGGASAGISVAF